MKNPTEYVQDDWPNDADTVPRRRGFDIEQMRSVRASRIQRDIDRPIICTVAETTDRRVWLSRLRRG